MVAVSATFLLLWENPMSKQLVKEEFIPVYGCRRIESMMAGAAGTPGGSASWELTPWTASTKQRKWAGDGPRLQVPKACLQWQDSSSEAWLSKHPSNSITNWRQSAQIQESMQSSLIQTTMTRSNQLAKRQDRDFHVELWGQLPVLSTHYTERWKYLTG